MCGLVVGNFGRVKEWRLGIRVVSKGCPRYLPVAKIFAVWSKSCMSSC